MISVAWKFIVSPKRHTRRVIIQERKSISFAERKSTQIVKELGGARGGRGGELLPSCLWEAKNVFELNGMLTQ